VGTTLKFALIIPRVKTSVADPVIGQTLSYVDATQRYTFNASSAPLYSDVDPSSSFGPADISSDSDNHYLIYSHSCPTFGKMSSSTSLRIFRAGNVNDLLALNFASFGIFTYGAGGIGFSVSDVRPFTFGVPTSAAALPSTGSATYNGIVIGSAAINENPSDTSGNFHYYDIAGSLHLTVNFASKAFTGTLEAKLTSVGDGSTPAKTYNVTIPVTQSGAATLAPLNGSAGAGRLTGFLAGSAAEEAGISFSLVMPDPADPTKTISLAGAGAGKR